ncbi:MAG: glutamate-1-semialdehyde 2,1-aminomutase [Thaumarchaeota archaeon]|nr:glutamate-1-semialdehyde 2,1-aminomutase [Nitrososphaerota archaeon]
MTQQKIKETRSKELFERAKKIMPGGVNSPVRAFSPYPFFTARAEGSKLIDVDGRTYIDYCLSYGPLILGHANPVIIEAVKEKLNEGTMYGTPTELEIEFAETVAKAVPCIEMMRAISSGTEATMHAIRAARGHTGRDKIVKFEGCYHGAHDYVLVKAGSGASTFGSPDSLGVPRDTVKNTVVLPYNDVEAFEEAVRKEGSEIAAVILEPVVGNAGVILPEKGYLQALRKITEKNGIVLIFDEVITGFRLALGGAQEYYGVKPDLVTLGKIIGGGFPIGAYGGKREIMSKISPVGPIYQAGTLSGNPVSVTAGLTVLNILMEKRLEIYGGLEKNGNKMAKGLRDYASDAGIEAQVNNVASMFQIFFTGTPVKDYASAKSSDTKRFTKYHRNLLQKGVFIPPSQFETCFLSTAHTDEDLNRTLEAMGTAIKASEEE